MVWGLFALAAALLAAGHRFRAMRWGQLLGMYEDPPRELLAWTLGVGYTGNFFLPFRAGDLLRAVLLGRRLENGFALSLSTILLDYGLDVPAVCLLFGALRLCSPESALLAASFRWYLLFSLLLILAAAVAVAMSKQVKQLMKRVCAVFNEHIEFSLLFFCFTAIMTVKDAFRRVRRGRLFLNTAVMWGCYLGSYAAVAAFLTKTCAPTGFSDVIVTLFSPASLGGSLAGNVSGQGTKLWFSLYILAALALLLAASALLLLLRRRAAPAAQLTAQRLLPQIRESDRLEFLDLYFSGENRDFVSKYLALNRDISVLQNLSGGSYATTLLCMDEKGSFYRKYAFSKDCGKLREQVEWVQAHRGRLPLPQITGVREGDGYYCYDMACDPAALSFFNYIHSASREQSAQVLDEVLAAVREGLHAEARGPADAAAVEQYIARKVTDNFERLEGAKALRQLTAGDYLTVNGRRCRNLPLLRRAFSPEKLACVFRDTPLADIHGDLTVDNIVCYSDGRQPDFYLIDPNAGNILDSPLLDHAKLLQSLHGSYEFYMRAAPARLEGGELRYVLARSAGYQHLYERYREYLLANFSRREVCAIYCHEIVHWLRLMPYKLEKDEARASLFYAGFLIAANDVLDLFGEDLDEACAL